MAISAGWEISPALRLAQLQGMLARANEGAANSKLRVYITQRPPSIASAHTDTYQAEIVLDKPCGVIVSNTLVLRPLATTGAMIQLVGMPVWAEWFAGDGVLLARCNVTDADNGGGIRVAGGKTPEGEYSPMLYSGGLVVLTQVTLT